MEHESDFVHAAGLNQPRQFRRRMLSAAIVAAVCTVSAWAQPTISSISPAIADQGTLTPVTVTVNGTNLTPLSVVQWVNGSTVTSLTTAYVVSTPAPYLTATITPDLFATAGTFGIQVSNPFGTQFAGTSSPAAFVVAGLTLTNLSPSQTAAFGSSAIQVALTGTGFTTNGQPSFFFTPPGMTSTQINTVTALSDTSATITIPSALLQPAGLANIRVQRNALSADLGFILLQPSLTLTLSPSTLPVGSSINPLTINVAGINLSQSSSIAVDFNGTQLTASYFGPTQATVQVPASALSIAGPLSVTLTTQGATGSTTFTATAPTITTVTPIASVVGQPIPLTVNGTNFIQGSFIIFTLGGVQTPVSATFVNATQLTATVPGNLTGSVGTATVAVQNGQALPVSNTAAIQIGNVLAISSASPSSVVAGTGAATVTVNGSGFSATTVVQIGGLTLTPSSFTATQLVVSVPVAVTNATGFYMLDVYDTASLQTSNQLPFNVTLQITATPSPISAGSKNVTLQVSAPGGFTQNAVVIWNGNALSTQYVSPQKVTALLPDASLTTAGVTNTFYVDDGNEVLSNTVSILVTTVTPVISTITPASAYVNDPDTVVTIAGTGFQTDGGLYTGARVLFTPPGGTAVQLTPSASSTTSLTVTIPHAQLTPAGNASIAVINVSDQITSPSQTFVIHPRAIITSVSPNPTPAGGDTVITLGGAFLSPNDTVSIAAPGCNSPSCAVALIPVSISGSTTLTALLPGTAINTPGLYNVYVVTSSTVVSAPAPLTVSLQLTSLSPQQIPQGQNASQQITVNAIGGFSQSSVVYFNNQPLQSTSYVSPTQLTATVPAALIASAGPYPVVVKTSPSTVSNALTFTVVPNGQLSSVSPSSAFAGGSQFTIVVNGNNFTGSSQVFFGSSQLVTTVVSPQVLTAVVPASAIASAGNFPITVNNSSNPINFPVYLEITSLSPASIAAGGPSFNLTVNLLGGVTSSSTVVYGGTTLATVSNTSTSVTATVPSNLIANPATPPVYVQDGTNQSNSVAHFVTGAISLTSLSPPHVDAGSTGFILQITGAGFATGTVASVGSVPLATSVLSSTLLQITLLDAMIAVPGNLQVTATNAAYQTSNPLTLAVLTPLSVTSVSPNSTIAGSAQFLMNVTGTGFDAQSTVTWSNGSTVSSLSTIFVSPAQLQAIVPAALVAQAGKASAGVVDGVGRVSSTTAGFTINPCSNCPSFLILSLSPNSAIVGNSVNLTITGAGFLPTGVQSGAYQANVVFGGTSIPANSVTATQITVTIPANLITQAGTVNVSVFLVLQKAQSNSLPFTITTPNPYINSLNPSAVQLRQSGITLQVSGYNFKSGAVIDLDGSPLSTTFINSGLLTAPLPAFTAQGSSLVTVKNSDGLTSNAVSLAYGGVSPVSFSLNALGPYTAAAGGPAFTLTAYGFGFQTGAVINFAGTPLVTTFVYSDLLTATVPASLITTVGSYPVTVTVPGSGNSNTIYFTVAAKPYVITLGPGTISAGASGFTLTVSGGGFVPGATIQFGGVSLTTIFGTSTQLSASVPANLVNTAGPISVTILNPDGTQSDPVIFNAVPFALTSANPGSANAGGQSFTLTLTGKGFVNGATATFNGTAITTTFVSATMLTATVPAALIASPGTALIKVTNPDGAVGGPLNFVIQTSVTLTAVTPASAPAGSGPLTITASGTGFVSGAVIKFNGSSIVTAFGSATSLTGTVTADLLASQGPVSVAVTNPDGTTTNSLPFTITPPVPPAITSLSPSSAPAGSAQDLTITITGTGFSQGSTVLFGNTPVVATFVGPTQLTVTVPAGLLTTAGAVTIKVTNPNGDQSNSFQFTVGPPLSITKLSPAASWAGAADTKITVTGTSFVSGATVVLGTTLLTTTFVSSSQLTATVPAAQLATPGSSDVTVTNPDGTISNATPFVVVALPAISVNATISAAGTNQVSVTLDSPALVDLTGTIALSFTASSQNTPSGYADPAMQFAAGGTTLSFTIPQGSKTAVLASNGAFSPGSVAGTLTIALTKLTAGSDNVLSNPAPSKSFTIGAAAPVITAGSVKIINGTSAGFTVELLGFSTTREISKANFTFTSSSPIDGGGTFSVDITQAVNTYFASAAGLANGGTFKLDIPFTIAGADASVVTGVSVTLVNSAGTSQAVSGGR